MNGIEQFENLAERLVEGTFARLFSDRLSPMKVAAHLERAIEEHQVCASGGTPEAPTHYWVYLNPRDYEALKPNPPDEHEVSAEEALARQISELVSDADLALDGPPTVHIRPDEKVPLREVRVDARWGPEEADPSEGTRKMERAQETEDGAPTSEGPKGRPFLILEGRRHVNLTEPVVSIGRALDNDVIIDDPRVSRHHAQMRHRYGHYVLYDLDSSGGTRINDYPVEECVLHSGDVISFAGVEVVYGEDPPTPIPLPTDEDTQALAKTRQEG
ncbi:MAG: DUF3662 and FHA domain-containing protein [Chloroflexota bacterium]|nr:DUF3662 and FHA domain-containing protein [Chloroflexota bacterium]